LIARDPESRADLASSEERATEPSEEGRPIAPRAGWWMPVATLVIGALVTAVLTVVTHTNYTDNEQRLLGLRVRDAGSLIIGNVPASQTPLASAAALAQATGGNADKFRQFAEPYVAAGPAHQFVSLSLWRLGGLGRGPVAVVGLAPELRAAAGAAFLERSVHRSMMSVVGLLAARQPRLGYAFGVAGRGGGFVAYGERPLPANRRSQLQSSSAFAGLDYAIYLGRTPNPRNLLVTDSLHPPLKGLTAMEVVPFGDSTLTLVMSSRSSLAGSVPEDLPWIIAAAGAILTLAGVAGAVGITRRRRDAERLAGRFQRTAGETRRLYAEQRSIAQTLQHALLPTLPEIPGIVTNARYVAGERGVDIGGDWYDLIDQGSGRVLIVVGDVSGRGLHAATTMVSLRYAIQAYAAQGDPPALILQRTARLVNVADTGQLATVLIAGIDVAARQITVTSAGHLPPLLLAEDRAEFVQTRVGLPIGVDREARYETTTVPSPRRCTLLAFTDGLVERRGESLDRGLSRLRLLAGARRLALPDLLETLVSELNGASEDDIAIVGVRWTT
jgi:hypothetical protein